MNSRLKTFIKTNIYSKKEETTPVLKSGFTLAEVLITLGIIGVVAAMTIPNLIANIKDKRTYTQLKATQSILSNAIRLAEDEYGDMTGWNVKMDYTEADAKAIAQVLKQFLKLALDCGTMDENGMCSPKVRYKLLNGTEHSGNYYDNKKYYKVVLLNGSSIWWRSAQENEYKDHDRVAVFWIDLNGDKAPNQVGRDLFLYDYERGSFRPQGAPGYHEDGTCNLSAPGWGCAYFVLQHGHMKYPKE